MVMWVQESVGRGARPVRVIHATRNAGTVENVGKTACWEAFQKHGVDSRPIFTSEGAHS